MPANLGLTAVKHRQVHAMHSDLPNGPYYAVVDGSMPNWRSHELLRLTKSDNTAAQGGWCMHPTTEHIKCCVMGTSTFLPQPGSFQLHLNDDSNRANNCNNNCNQRKGKATAQNQQTAQQSKASTNKTQCAY
jgi:hypothetical protein